MLASTSSAKQWTTFSHSDCVLLSFDATEVEKTMRKVQQVTFILLYSCSLSEPVCCLEINKWHADLNCCFVVFNVFADDRNTKRNISFPDSAILLVRENETWAVIHIGHTCAQINRVSLSIKCFRCSPHAPPPYPCSLPFNSSCSYLAKVSPGPPQGQGPPMSSGPPQLHDGSWQSQDIRLSFLSSKDRQILWLVFKY